MARYAYDVNTTRRYIDVHKQFSGGLKTVDTDDSLGSVFLRQAENVSLSEFGFVEKRYGTHEKFTLPINGTLQGYWEFRGFAVYAVDNTFYYTNLTNLTEQKKVDSLLKEKESEWHYPSDIPQYPFISETYRDMNAVNINNVLYIFTGFYPVYVKKNEETNELKFYLFSADIATYNEMVVTGHNLLESNYNETYGYEGEILKQKGNNKYGSPSNFPRDFENKTFEFMHILKDDNDQSLKSYYPRVPFSTDGRINFSFNYELAPQLGYDQFQTTNFRRYFSLELDEVAYRNSGPGTTEESFVPSDLSKVNWTNKTNYGGTEELIIPKGVPLLESVSLGDAFIQKNKKGQAENNGQLLEFYTKKIKTNDIIDRDVLLANDDYYFLFETDEPLGGVDADPLPVGFNTVDNFLKPFSVTQAVKNENDLDVPATERLENVLNYDVKHIRVRIAPINAEGEEFKTDAIALTGDDLKFDETTKRYSFKIPEALSAFENAVKFSISFRMEVTFEHAGKENENDFHPLADMFYTLQPMTFVKPSTAENLLSFDEGNGLPPDIDFYLENLVAGTFDFRVTFKLKQLSYQDPVLDVHTNQDGVFRYQVYFYDVPITAEKLDDLPGKNEDFLPKLNPVWSCNKVVEHYGKLMVWGSEKMPTAVFYSFPDRPTYFPSTFYLDFTNSKNDPVESVVQYSNILVVQTAEQTWGIRGNSGLITAPAPYVPFSINSTVGTIAYKSVRPVRNQLFFLSKQGIVALNSLYAVDESYNITFVDRNIRNIVPQDSGAVGIQFDNQYWLNFPESGITLRWYIDKKAWVQDKYTAWNDFNGIAKWQIDDGVLEFITYPSRFYEEGNLVLYKVGVDYQLPSDLSKAVVAKFETSFLNQNYPFHPKNYKEAKLDFTLQNEYNQSRDAVYTMVESEDIETARLHIIDDVPVVKNHFYKIQYDFEPQYNEFDGGDFTTSQSDILDGDDFASTNNPNGETAGNLLYITGYAPLDAGDFTTTALTNIIDGGSFSLLLPRIDVLDGGVVVNNIIDATFSHLVIENVTVREHNSNTSYSLNEVVIGSNFVSFQLPDTVKDGKVDIEVFGNFINYIGGADLYDVTYDDSLTFKTWIISEDQTLNLDNLDTYDQAKAALDVNLNNRLGTWVFGTSDFGKTVTAVKTIKLSGKGYNSKLYMEDFSKSKWTLESLGLTYKMKRARSR